MNRNKPRFVLALAFFCVVFQGCEMLRGVKKHANNTTENLTSKGSNKLIELDKRMQENWW